MKSPNFLFNLKRRRLNVAFVTENVPFLNGHCGRYCLSKSDEKIVFSDFKKLQTFSNLSVINGEHFIKL